MSQLQPVQEESLASKDPSLQTSIHAPWQKVERTAGPAMQTGPSLWSAKAERKRGPGAGSIGGRKETEVTAEI